MNHNYCHLPKPSDNGCTGEHASLPYKLNIAHRGSTQNVVLGLVPDGSRVLDLGCASGYLGDQLKQRQCEVWGMDIDINSIRNIPTGVYSSVYSVDLDTVDRWPFPPHSMDIVLAADVVEHLRFPEVLLSRIHEILVPGGMLIVSLPNVAHISVRLPLLFGRFNYQPSGILDKTHLHLYTFSSACTMITRSGFTIESILSGSDWSGWLLNHSRVVHVARLVRGLLATDIIIAARITYAHISPAQDT